MPVLKNPKHEKFAQGLAKGLSQEKAYKEAGYNGNRKAASNLWTNVDIQERVAELTKQGAEEAKKRISFEARDQFERLEKTLEGAEAAGEWRVVAETRIKILEMFGYRDHPTLTHEHVNNTRVDVHPSETKEPEKAPANSNQRFRAVAGNYRKA